MYAKEFGSAGLTSMNQIVDTTDNRMFSTGEDTSGVGVVERIIFPETPIRFPEEMPDLTPFKIHSRRKEDERSQPSGIMPLALVIGTCKSIPKES
ncbi:Uncharacterised protein [uncultured archaeon]|nr:Uncharacterised protein [uncultured archaeon]